MLLINLLQIVWGDVSGGEAGLEAFDIDDDTGLAVHTGDSAFDAFERTIGDTYQIVGHETALLHIDFHHVGITDGSGADEQFHGFGGDRQRRVEACGVDVEVVVIEGGEA